MKEYGLLAPWSMVTEYLLMNENKTKRKSILVRSLTMHCFSSTTLLGNMLELC